LVARITRARRALVRLPLCAPQNKDVVQLQVGYHVLEGKKVALKKPLAILESQQVTGSHSSSSSPSSSQLHGAPSSSTQDDAGGGGSSSVQAPQLTYKVGGLVGGG
jgi:hypothetical protein